MTGGARRLATLVGVVSLFGTSSAAGQQGDGLAVLERASAHYEDIEALCAGFVQRLENLLGEHTSSGRLCQRRPDRFAMRFSDPEGDLVVIDGSAIWVYYPSNDDKVVIRIPVSADAAGTYDLHREFLERPAEKYDVVYEASEVVEGHDTHRLRLTPKERSTYLGATLWIDTGAPVLRRIRIDEDRETVRTLSFSAVDLNPTDLTPEWFTFTPPEGAQVISR